MLWRGIRERSHLSKSFGLQWLHSSTAPLPQQLVYSYTREAHHASLHRRLIMPMYHRDGASIRSNVIGRVIIEVQQAPPMMLPPTQEELL